MKPWDNIEEEEWESICDRCGKCCLIKLQDEDTDETYYTNVICKYYDTENAACTIYPKRCETVEGCLKLTKDNVDKLDWMPRTCAYRKLFEKDFVQEPVKTVRGRVISEEMVNQDELEDYIVDWEDL